jgi:uncharacterized radical SAM protein YgiQ
MPLPFLPVTKEETTALGWERPDFVYVFGDAYVDHPSFGHAIISRVLEAAGFRVAMLPQPDWRGVGDFQRFGRPRLGFLVSAGNIDSMVNHYTSAKKPRSEDLYSPGGKAGRRPDRATIVYCNRIREAYRNIPIIIGGLEASLRRFAHYDYWDDAVRRSILTDSGANLLSFGMGERALVQIAKLLDKGVPVESLRTLPGTCCVVEHPEDAADAIALSGWDIVRRGGMDYARTFQTIINQQDAVRGKRLIQQQDRAYVVQNPPAAPLTQRELDEVYELPYMRQAHPMYAEAGGVPAITEVEFSLTSSRGCYGGCSFCALTYHQGRVVQARSHESLLREARILIGRPGFKGYIHDVGGPTANFRAPACDRQAKHGACAHRQCLFPKPCEHLRADHSDYLALLRALRALPGVKKVFVRSGLRYDYLLHDPEGDTFLRELCEHHISGQLKVAPEHVSARVLQAMGKPAFGVYQQFVERYRQQNARLGRDQYLVPYFISSHPGSTLKDAIEMAEAMRDMNIRPEQVQDFYPTPATVSTCMYFTGIDPRTLKPVHVPQGEERRMQRALLQYTRPQNHALVRQALRLAGREDLIGYEGKCLVRPERFAGAGAPPKAPGKSQEKPGAGKPTAGKPVGKPVAGKPAFGKPTAGKAAAGKAAAAVRGEKAAPRPKASKPPAGRKSTGGKRGKPR